ncbi:MAG: Uma2 family endonuclease [Anaerolineae bacterium]|nr:Uma2 family endonuclease [Anaerolineae bacterium]
MLDAPAKPKLLSLDDLLKLGKGIEIIDGQVLQKSASGILHQLASQNVHHSIDTYLNQFNFGVIFSTGLTYLMLSDTKGLKNSFVPDISFIRLENILPLSDNTKPYPGIPDLAVEVISPGEDADDIQTKLRTYLEKGTEQVWLVYPTTKELHQYRRDENPEIRIYRGSQTLDLADLFPGLELTTDQIFTIPEWALR